jgi:hypothetical protein
MSIPKRKYLILALGLLLLLTLGLAACRDEGTQTVEVTRIVEVPVEIEGETVEVTRIVEVPVEVPAEGETGEGAETAGPNVPFLEQWASSPHADAEAEAFVHWNEEDPAEVPDRCAKCHSTPGFLDYLGADGSEARVVNGPAPIGTTVTCEACHNEVASNLTSVVFPSGAEITGLGPQARCMECHQGRASTVQVNNSIAEAGLEGQEDTVSEDLGFTNIHYYAAAATQYGTWAMGGYQYDGRTYDAKFDHVEPYDTCVDCHDPHTLEVQLDECAACHEDVEEAEDLIDIRMLGSLVDYDGDDDMEEGIYEEIEGMRAILYAAMQSYAAQVTGTGIVYDEHAHPYFFADTNGDGVTDEGEVNGDNAFGLWTPRLAKAAYNYQVSLKDPGRYAHGGKYIIQLLYDSIDSLSQASGVTLAVPLEDLRRIDHGHFAASEEAFRHWDAEGGVVPATCSKCHSAGGLPTFIRDNALISQPASSGLNCATCHNDLQEYTRYEVAEVRFPSGAVLGFEEPDSNLCIQCHQGRESTTSMNRLIGDLGPDEQSESLRFLNVHYFAAGATLFGTEAKGAYEYEGQTYVGRFEHVGSFNTCNECHSTHALQVVVDECAECHSQVEGFETLVNIRTDEATILGDFDGDGDETEGIAMEIATMEEALYEALVAATAATGTPIGYDSHSHPYFFFDTDGDGAVSEDEAVRDNQFNAWTPRLLRAAYNYQYAQKDPGDFAHNSRYIIQILYDSIQDVGGDVSAMTRP